MVNWRWWAVGEWVGGERGAVAVWLVKRGLWYIEFDFASIAGMENIW